MLTEIEKEILTERINLLKTLGWVPLEEGFTYKKSRYVPAFISVDSLLEASTEKFAEHISEEMKKIVSEIIIETESEHYINQKMRTLKQDIFANKMMQRRTFIDGIFKSE
jgi:hypothetical protein